MNKTNRNKLQEKKELLDDPLIQDICVDLLLSLHESGTALEYLVLVKQLQKNYEKDLVD